MNIPNSTSSNNECITLQNKVFTRWVNEMLKGANKNCEIKDITKDLSDGTIIFQLAQILTKNNSSNSINDEIKLSDNIAQNYQSSIDMFTKDGVELNEISMKDINENSDKTILQFIWKLISHYSIQKSLSSTQLNKDNNETELNTEKIINDHKDALLSWANNRISTYPYVKNFQPYVLALCALLDSYIPEKINYYSLDPNDSENNLQIAFNAMKYLGIPIYIIQEDILQKNENIDEKALLTQLSSFKIVMDIQQSITHSFTQTNTENEEIPDKKLEETSSNTSAEFEYDSYSSSESQDKLSSNESSANQTIAAVLFETQRVTQKQIEKLMGKIEFLTEQLYESRGKVGELTRQSKEDQKTIQLLKQELANTPKLSQNQSENNQLTTEIDQLKKQLSDSGKEVKELTNKITETDKQANETISALKQQISELESKLENEENKSKEATLNLEQKQAEIANLTSENIQLKEQFSELQQKQTENDSLILENNQLKQQMADLQQKQTEIDSLTSENDQLKQQLSNLQQKQTEVDSLTSENDQLKQQLLNLQQKQTEVDSLTSENDQLKQHLSNLQQKQTEVDSLTSENDQLKQQLSNLQQKQTEVDSLTSENDQLKHQLLDSQNNSKELESKLTEAENKAQETIASLQRQISEINSKQSETQAIETQTENNENESSVHLQLSNIEIQEKPESVSHELSLQMNVFNESIASPLSQNDMQSEIERLTVEVKCINDELTCSLKNEASLTKKLNETESNYNLAVKELQETRVSMRKALLDSENKYHIFTVKTQDEIDDLTIENRYLKDELDKSQQNEKALANTLDEIKKKAENEVENLMQALSDAENRSREVYNKNQSEIESLKMKLADSQDQVKLHEYEFDELKKAFTASQAQVCDFYQQLCDLKSS